ncbi:hypothetical protein [Halosimplex amylolyticum]|uniref:hypothetical protein n=1 Tax=Halosimplex amylolyticum TaxID=3396616 RepID=UPI003F561C9A
MLLVVALWALYRGREWLVFGTVVALVVAAASRLLVRVVSSFARSGACAWGASQRPDTRPCDCQSTGPEPGDPAPPPRPGDAWRQRQRGYPLAVFYIDGDADAAARPDPDDPRGRQPPEADDE